ncbi:MAG TPA: hypothetical protein VKW06_00345 [Candidatus Angelobacter sp.]|nr:hypothetical protein [Candidatus Angelobacter sp.]
MGWLDEGLEFLKGAFKTPVELVGAKKFSTETFAEIKTIDPLKDTFSVTTLAALRDLINCNAEKLTEAAIPLIHIVNHAEVRLEVGLSDVEGRRQVFAKASPVPYDGFKFNAYHSVENFVIAIQAHFALTPDRDYLLKTASRVTDEGVTVAEDDGISQRVTVNAALALKTAETLKSRVSLRPFRIFPEVEQPESEFIFRAKKSDQGVLLALHEADGGKWKVRAIENIAWHLRNLEIKLPIIS